MRMAPQHAADVGVLVRYFPKSGRIGKTYLVQPRAAHRDRRMVQDQESIHARGGHQRALQFSQGSRAQFAIHSPRSMSGKHHHQPAVVTGAVAVAAPQQEWRSEAGGQRSRVVVIARNEVYGNG